ncbi:MAG: DUF4381 domain-containing protein [Gammaproteobacteria bacterium]|nr:DUF4381 domain-containing protein [Gammaproteobacteria bacterium]
MTTTNPASLENLNDIVMPASVGWWPLADGWYVLAGIVFILLTWFIFKSVRNWKANAYRRSALLELRSLTENAENRADHGTGLRKLPALLKRTALSAYPRETVARLSGEDWLLFLNSKVKKPSFTQNTFDTLNQISYTTGDLSDVNDDAVSALVGACGSWIKHHLVDSGPRQPGGS